MSESDQGKKPKESSPEKLPEGEALGAKWRRRGAEEGEKGNELLKKKVLEGERDGAKENLNVEKHSAAEVSAIVTEQNRTERNGVS